MLAGAGARRNAQEEEVDLAAKDSISRMRVRSWARVRSPTSVGLVVNMVLVGCVWRRRMDGGVSSQSGEKEGEITTRIHRDI